MFPVCRITDKSTYDPCGAGPRPNNQGSPNVFANFLALHTVSMRWVLHACPLAYPHGAVTVSGSLSVFVNGRPLSRVTDRISCGSRVMVGSHNVFAG